VSDRDPAGAVFEALADPMRRRLLQTISASPATATELADELPISRQAVSKHLSSLSSAGLLQRERSGRDVRYRVTPAPLSEAVSWMADVGGQWDERLGRLARISAAADPGRRPVS
jgi:DNA-binding transcriptional ArsR family regulator